MLNKLQNFFSAFIGRYAPAFITLLILAGVFFFYFNVILSRNEENLKERNFRGLHRMANNLSKKISNYAEKNSQNFFLAWEKSERKTKEKSNPDSALQSFIKTEYGLENAPPDNRSDKNEPFFIKFSNGWQLFFKDTAKDSKRLASVPIQKFAEPLLRRDLFPHYFLAIDDTILLDELNISNKSLGAYLPGKYATDSVKKGPIIQSGQIRNIEIGGKEFKLFLLPFIVEGKYKFSLGGYIPAESYASQQKYIPTYAILWLVIGIIVVVLMFPLLKVFLMHRSEQLLSRNAVSSLASVHILGSIVMLVAINIYVYFTIIREGVNKNLKELAVSIDSSFTSEVKAGLNQMDTAEIELKASKNIQDRYGDSFFFKSYPYSRHISWIDSSGQQLIRWSKNDYPSEKINVNDRDYFQVVKQGNLWHRENGKPYYLTEISSWVSDLKMAIISRPVDSIIRIGKDSSKSSVISLSGRFNSLFNPVLPNGFGFCIIKDNGLVLFHHDEKHNSNENLVEECNDNAILLSLLHAKSAGYFGSMYSGTTQRFYVKPIDDMPYYIVTFRDMKSIWSEDLDVISASSILTLMSLAVILLVILIIQAAGYRHSLLQSQSILFTWLQPNSDLKNAYKRVSIVYLSAIVLQPFFFFAYKGQDQLCQVGISFSYAYILITCAYYQFTIFSHSADAGKKQENWLPFYFLAGLWLIINSVFVAFSLHNGKTWFIVSQLPLLIVAFLVSVRNPFGRKTKPTITTDEIINSCRATAKKIFKIAGDDPNSYKRWYTRSIFLFISATAIVPSLIFYCLLFKQERVLCLKYCQADFATQLLQKHRGGPAEDTLIPSYQRPYYFGSFAQTAYTQKSVPAITKEPENDFESIYTRIKPSFSAYSTQIEYLKNDEDPAKELHWSYLPDSNTMLLRYKISTTRAFDDSSHGLFIKSRVESIMQKFNQAIHEDTLSFLLLVAALFLLLLGFHFLLSRLIKKVFFDGYNDPGAFKEFDAGFIHSLLNETRENVFVNGLVNSGKHRIIRGYCDPAKPLEFDIALLSPSKDVSEDVKKFISQVEKKSKIIKNKKVIVLINHFEMYMNDLKATERKLTLLESLLREEKIQIIILSSRSFDSMAIKGTTEEKKEVDFTDRWSNVMNQFYSVYHHWTVPDEIRSLKPGEVQKELKQYCRDKINEVWDDQPVSAKQRLKRWQIIRYRNDQLNKFFQKLDNEFRHSDFLWDIRGSIFGYIKDNKEKCLKFNLPYRKKYHTLKIIKRDFNDLYEQVCLKIQALACKYYLATWHSLSYEERKTLYDIALDEMVNPSNRDIATRLAGLGLIIRLKNSAGYEIMSKSFRNFIFTQLDKKDVDSFQLEAAEKGSWRSFQLPILIVVIALSIFLLTTQKDAFTNLVTYLGSVALGIGSLLKLLGAIPSSK
ncbi:MAG: cache domain-containing protein [Chitinophagaceae bacterium]